MIDYTDTFTLSFPLWVISRPGWNIDGMLSSRGSTGELYLVMFTDIDLAKAAIETSPFSQGYELREIHDPFAFYGLLRLLQQAGTVTSVSFDSSENNLNETRSVDHLARHFEGHFLRLPLES